LSINLRFTRNLFTITNKKSYNEEVFVQTYGRVVELSDKQKKLPRYETKAYDYDVIVIGASAGGVESLMRLAAMLPENMPAAIFIVVHIPTLSISNLPAILSRSGPLEALHPTNGENIQPGRIYIAPPNHHMLLSNNKIRLSTGPKEHGHRPAVDPLFHSAARHFGPKVVGIILSGTLGDGAEGLLSIKNMGGMTIVQDPEEAIFRGMPLNAIDKVQVDDVLGIADIAEKITQLAGMSFEPVGVSNMKNDPERKDTIISEDFERFKNGEKPANNSILSCPDCGGVLFEMGESDTPLFVCHVGHSFSIESFLENQSEALETAMWTAVRVMNERVSLLSRMANKAAGRGSEKIAGRYFAQAREIKKTAELIHQALMQIPDETMFLTNPSEEESLSLDESLESTIERE
jgi:two-component system, chemotaxis family, protein-glutamate methylesterase/glutaminase